MITKRGDSELSDKFEIVETETFQKVLKDGSLNKIYNKITTYIYPQLRSNPFFGINIKKLKGTFEGIYRYRLGNYRLFYIIDNEKVVVVVLDLRQRKDAYKKKSAK